MTARTLHILLVYAFHGNSPQIRNDITSNLEVGQRLGVKGDWAPKENLRLVKKAIWIMIYEAGGHSLNCDEGNYFLLQIYDQLVNTTALLMSRFNNEE